MGAFASLLWLEWKRPLRRAREPKLRRDVRNLAIAGTAAIALRCTEQPAIAALMPVLVRCNWGLVRRTRLPLWAEVPVSVALMDYTLYVWHVLTHKVPWLWRFHVAHHVDLDLDASTAIRFHFGELTQSVAWRCAQLIAIGPSPFALSVWQTFLILCILFHHSNVRLPGPVERRIAIFVMTPRLHGIHHSTVEEETNSNWSSGLTVWDWLHRTLRTGPSQDEITIGVPAYHDPAAVTLPRILALPFETQPDYWSSRARAN